MWVVFCWTLLMPYTGREGEREKGDKKVIEKEEKQTSYTFNNIKSFLKNMN